ncbi:MAG: thiamine-phosphate kinase, partial [Stellaceae bacterium]
SLPLSPAAAAAIATAPEVRARLAAMGDDYELVFTAPPGADEAVARAAADSGVPVAAIGTIAPGEGVHLVDETGGPVAVDATGYRHF